MKLSVNVSVFQFFFRISAFDKLNCLSNIIKKKTGKQNVVDLEMYQRADRDSIIMQRYISVYTFIAVPILYVIPIAYKSYYAYYTADPTACAFQLFYHVA